MVSYKHTQIGYLLIVVTLAVLALFVLVYSMASAELLSVGSGPNFAMTALMTVILFILTSFTTLTTSIDENYIRVTFGYGIFQKKISLQEIASIKTVKNRWYYGWGIKVWFWPYMWIYSISGLDAVEITMKNGNVYRVGTDEPMKLESAISATMRI
jgi:hypothetical protein